MQILFSAGVELGAPTAGLGVLPGTVRRLAAPVLPHMGWNTVRPAAGSRLFAGAENERFYFVHSYGVPEAELADPAPGAATVSVSTTEYGSRFVAAVESGPLWATQFHPEKSGAAGAVLLRNWVATL
jgi:glutamine amidotransferase